MDISLLHDNLIQLRAVEPEDLEALYKWENDTSIWADGCSMAPYSKSSIREYISTYDPDIFKAGQLRLMVTLRESGTAVGTIDLYEFDFMNRRAGVGILIDPGHRHNGYGSRSLDILRHYAGNFLGLHQLWAIVGIENDYSLQLFRKSGYNICGRLKSWLRKGKSYSDAYILQRFID